MAVRAIASMVAPPSLQRLCRCRSPFSAVGTPPRRGDGHLGLRVEVVEVRQVVTLERLADDGSRGVADAVELGERAGLRPAAQLVRRHGPHDVERPDERLGLEAGVVGAVEAVDDSFQGFDRGHPAESTRCVLPAPEGAQQADAAHQEGGGEPGDPSVAAAPVLGSGGSSPPWRTGGHVVSGMVERGDGGASGRPSPRAGWSRRHGRRRLGGLGQYRRLGRHGGVGAGMVRSWWAARRSGRRDLQRRLGPQHGGGPPVTECLGATGSGAGRPRYTSTGPGESAVATTVTVPGGSGTVTVAVPSVPVVAANGRSIPLTSTVICWSATGRVAGEQRGRGDPVRVECRLSGHGAAEACGLRVEPRSRWPADRRDRWLRRDRRAAATSGASGSALRFEPAASSA